MGINTPRSNGVARIPLAKAAPILLLLLSLSTPLFAQTGADTLRTLPWELMVAAAVMVTYSIVAIAFLLGEGFAVPEVKAWAVNEVYQVTAVLIIILIVFVTVRAENGVFSALGYAPSPVNPNPAISAANEFLDVSRSYLTSIAASAYSSNAILVALLRDRAIKTDFIDVSDVIEHLYDTFSDVMGMAVGGIQTSIGVITAQRWFLDLIARTAFTIFLPLGILLRTFSFTRGLGAFFIAIAISFYLVYPLTFILDQKIMDALLCKSDNPASCAPDAWSHLSELRISSLPSEAAYRNSIGAAVIGALGSLKVLLTETAFAFVTFTMLAILNFVITAGVTRSISNLMGYDVRIGDIIKVL